ncbi:MAG TPA: hypothetical protein VIB08_10200 [Thermoanaerobaculia bacterium]
MKRVVRWLDRRWMDASWILPGAPNRWAIRVFAQRRSGHHAIVDWIRNQLPGRHCFLNDCKVGTNPFASAVKTNSIVRGWAGDHRHVNWELELRGRHARKGVLLYNYEDADIRAYAEGAGDSREASWIGESARRSTLLVLRDPYNLLASRLKWFHGRGERPTAERFDEFRSLWKLHAGEFLGTTRWLEEAVHVRYNEWFRSRAYRDELADRIGFSNGDVGLERIARWGPALAKRPASFDGLSYDGRAQDMKVLERWKEYAEDRFFRAQFEDEELIELSRRIFGEIEGTSRLTAVRKGRPA